MLLLAHTGHEHSWIVQPWEIHPALTHFPIAFLLGGVAIDFYSWWRGRPDLEKMATRLLAAGIFFGAVAGLTGVLAFATVPAHTELAHSLMYWHMGSQLTALSLFTWVAWTRRGDMRPRASSRLVSCLGAITLIIGSSLGGYIVFHGGAGVSPELLARVVREHKHGTTDGHPTNVSDTGSDHKHSEVGKKDGFHFEHTQSQKHPKSESLPELRSGQHSKEMAEEHTVLKPRVDRQDHDHQGKESPPNKSADKVESSHQDHVHNEQPKDKSAEKGEATHKNHGNKELMALTVVPPASAAAAYVAKGHTVQVVLTNLTYPSSLEFDDKGNLYIAEAGEAPGAAKANPRIIRIRLAGEVETVISHALQAPVSKLLWYQGRLYVSHGGKTSVWSEKGGFIDLVTGPAEFISTTQVMAVEPDGKLYLASGHRLVRIDAKTTNVETILGRMGSSKHAAGQHREGQSKSSNHDHDHAKPANEMKDHQDHEKKVDAHKGLNQPSKDSQASQPKQHVNGTVEQLALDDPATAGPRRLVAICFSPGREALYVLDFGAVFMTPNGPRPVPGTGVLWRIIRNDASQALLLP